LVVNEVETEDALLQLGQSEEYTYYNVGQIYKRRLFETSMDNPLVIYSTVLILGQTGMSHGR